MGWKKFIMGEKMPDKNDPQYAERYKKEVKAGRKFARWLKIDKAAERVQKFACKHPRWFLTIVFGIVIGCLTLNIYRVVQVCNRQQAGNTVTATQHQEKLLKERRNTKTIYNHGTQRPHDKD